MQRRMHCSVSEKKAEKVWPAWEEHSKEEGGGGFGGTRAKEKCRGYVAEKGGNGEEMRADDFLEDQRSSVSGMETVSERRARTRSMALFSARRHSFTLRKDWTWARAGKAYIKGGERDTGGVDRENRQGGRPCAKRLYPHPLIQACTHTDRGNETTTAAGFIWKKNLHKQIITQQGYSEKKQEKKAETSKGFVLCKNWFYVKGGKVLLWTEIFYRK